MKKFSLCIMSCVGIFCVNMWAGEWVMFSDGKDTYIYSTTSGEVYIRYNMGKKNYEDVFVRMPHGQQPAELQKKNDKGVSAFSTLPPTSSNSQVSSQNDKNKLKDMQIDALKRSQDMINSALE